MAFITPHLQKFDSPNTVSGPAGPIDAGPHNFAKDETDVIVGQGDGFHMQQTNFTSLSGRRVPTFFDDYYFRVYLLPDELDFGTFSQDKTITMTVWNAHLSTVQFVSSTPEDGTEVTMGGDPLPYDMRALEIKLYPFTAVAEGPSVLTDLFTLVFGSGEIKHVPVTGFRVPTLDDLVWPFPPNWSGGFTVEYEFKTEVLTSARGNEQRIRQRQMPRKKVTFRNDIRTNTDRIEFNRLMTANQKGRFYIPELTTSISLLDAMPANTIIARIEGPVPWWITDDSYVMLVNGNTYSLRRVDYVVEDSNSDGSYFVFFRSDDDLTWPVGSTIHPALSSWMNDEQGSNRLSNYVSTVNIEFRVRPGSEVPEPESAVPVSFNGRELWLKKPNWAQQPEVTDLHPTKFVDYGIGRMSRSTEIDFHTNQVRLSYVGRNRDEAEELRQFFFRCAGMWGEFYMPTWADDIIPKQGWIAGENRIAIDGVEFAEVYSDDTTKGAILIVEWDGTTTFKAIADIYGEIDSNSEPTSYIELTENLGADVALDDIEKICWVPVWRFATDVLTIEWPTDEVARTSFTVRTLEDLNIDDEDSNSASDT